MEFDIYVVTLCGLAAAFAATTVWLGRLLLRRARAQRLTRVFEEAGQCLALVEKVPLQLLSRDLRTAIRRMLHHYYTTMYELHPQHPYLFGFQARLSHLHRGASALKLNQRLSRSSRREAAAALKTLCTFIDRATRDGVLSAVEGDIARASSVFSANQLAVHAVRQELLEAEHMRAYNQALKLANHALRLCAGMPPRLGGSLRESIQGDIERVQRLAGVEPVNSDGSLELAATPAASR